MPQSSSEHALHLTIVLEYYIKRWQYTFYPNITLWMPRPAGITRIPAQLRNITRTCLTVTAATVGRQADSEFTYHGVLPLHLPRNAGDVMRNSLTRLSVALEGLACGRLVIIHCRRVLIDFLSVAVASRE